MPPCDATFGLIPSRWRLVSPPPRAHVLDERERSAVLLLSSAASHVTLWPHVCGWKWREKKAKKSFLRCDRFRAMNHQKKKCNLQFNLQILESIYATYASLYVLYSLNWVQNAGCLDALRFD